MVSNFLIATAIAMTSQSHAGIRRIALSECPHVIGIGHRTALGLATADHKEQ